VGESLSDAPEDQGRVTGPCEPIFSLSVSHPYLSPGQLTVRVPLRRTGNNSTRGGSLSSATGRSDVAEQLLPGDGRFRLDERVDRPFEDLGFPSGANLIRSPEDGLDSAGSEEQDRREGMHGGLEKTVGVGAGGEVEWMRMRVRLKPVNQEPGHDALYLTPGPASEWRFQLDFSRDH